jgi:hypothetical protein
LFWVMRGGILGSTSMPFLFAFFEKHASKIIKIF